MRWRGWGVAGFKALDDTHDGTAVGTQQTLGRGVLLIIVMVV